MVCLVLHSSFKWACFLCNLTSIVARHFVQRAYSCKLEVILCSLCCLCMSACVNFHGIILRSHVLPFLNYTFVTLYQYYFAFMLYCLVFLYTVSWVLFHRVATHHLQVSVCFQPCTSRTLQFSVPFFILLLLQLLLVLLFSSSYPDSQPTFRKHACPRQFGDDSLIPPELCLARKDHFNRLYVSSSCKNFEYLPHYYQSHWSGTVLIFMYIIL
jgi:hypothetical protein